jgi:hypothetical protein
MPQGDPTHALRFAIQLAEAEGYAECAAGLRTALAHLERTQPTDTQADLTERARALYETVICENTRLPITAARIVIPALVAFAQSEREGAAPLIIGWLARNGDPKSAMRHDPSARPPQPRRAERR